MDDKQQYFRLGLFVVISLVLLFCVLFVLGARSLFQPSMTFETYFNDSVAGLDVGAPVRFRGVTLGQVSAILTSPPLYEEDVPVDKRKAYIVVRATITGPARSYGGRSWTPTSSAACACVRNSPVLPGSST